MHSTFGDCSTEKGLKSLNDHLATRSYVDGYAPSAADAGPFAEVAKATHGTVTMFPHVTRWYMHIRSFPEITGSSASSSSSAAAAAPANTTPAKKEKEPKKAEKKEETKKEEPKKEEAKKEEKKPAADDEDIDLFGSDDEDDVAARKADADKKKAEAAAKNKKVVIGKSSIILDVKPWDDETDMAEMEKLVRSIEMKGLTWGWSKLVPVGYGIKKLQINCVVVDDDVSVDDLEERITAFESHVQSMDISAFNKI